MLTTSRPAPPRPWPSCPLCAALHLFRRLLGRPQRAALPAPKAAAFTVAVQVTGVCPVDPAPLSPADVGAVRVTRPRRAKEERSACTVDPALVHELVQALRRLAKLGGCEHVRASRSSAAVKAPGTHKTRTAQQSLSYRRSYCMLSTPLHSDQHGKRLANNFRRSFGVLTEWQTHKHTHEQTHARTHGYTHNDTHAHTHEHTHGHVAAEGHLRTCTPLAQPTRQDRR